MGKLSTAAQNLKAGTENMVGGLRGRKARLNSNDFEKRADMKVSNPTFVWHSKLSRHSFIRHVEAEEKTSQEKRTEDDEMSAYTAMIDQQRQESSIRDLLGTRKMRKDAKSTRTASSGSSSQNRQGDADNFLDKPPKLTK